MNRHPDSQQIEVLAYQIWESRGRPDGESEQHWREAEQRLEAAESMNGGTEDDDTIEPAPDVRQVKRHGRSR